MLLDYENDIIMNSMTEDNLLIMAKGLGIKRIFTKMLQLYCEPGHLVFVLNTSQNEQKFFIDELTKEDNLRLPKIVNSSYTSVAREALYLEGGIHFITSRVLVVDFLMKRIPVDLVSGILVFHADRILKNCQDSFILRLFKEQSKTGGFIKAFSESSVAFTRGYSRIERIISELRVEHLSLWPRFRSEVVQCLDESKVELIELGVPLTKAMVKCQSALLGLLNKCIHQLKQHKIKIDDNLLTTENVLSNHFEKLIKIYLTPIWHQLSINSRQLIADIKALKLMSDLVNTLSSVGPNQNIPSWVLMSEADSLISTAKERVYGSGKSDKTESGASKIEECPKWTALKDVLREIDDTLAAKTGGRRVLITGYDTKACAKLESFLNYGAQHVLQRELKRLAKLRNEKTATASAGENEVIDLQEINDNITQIDDEDDYAREEAPLVENSATSSTSRAVFVPFPDTDCNILKSTLTMTHPLTGLVDSESLTRTLNDFRPDAIVLYDINVAFVRELEVYKATRYRNRPLRIYCLVYDQSMEQQRYLTDIRLEKLAFEHLIQKKATMVFSTDKDDLEFKKTDEKIIVDIREFGCVLPSLIHRRNISIDPITLEVGDYILTPDICVERKSISDLIGSLANGRLYAQCQSMTRYYRIPTLLIEFTADKPFCLQSKFSREINNFDVISQLTLLVLHFPRLRIIWAQSPHATAELFRIIKKNRDEPNSEKAMTISEDGAEDLNENRFNPDVLVCENSNKVLLKFPGLNMKNVYSLMDKVKDLKEMASLTMEEFTQILGNKMNAQLLYDFLRKQYDTKVVPPTKKRPFKPYGKSSKPKSFQLNK